MFLQVPLAWSQCLGVFGVGLALNIVGIFLLFGLRVRHDYAVVSPATIAALVAVRCYRGAGVRRTEFFAAHVFSGCHG